jgi:hypothetical protein
MLMRTLIVGTDVEAAAVTRGTEWLLHSVTVYRHIRFQKLVHKTAGKQNIEF